MTLQPKRTTLMSCVVIAAAIGIGGCPTTAPRDGVLVPATPDQVHDLLGHARAQTYEAHGGWMDEQKLWQFERRPGPDGVMRDTLVPGPWARIMPVRGLGTGRQDSDAFYETTDEEAEPGWRPVARIVADASYDSLHIRTRGMDRQGQPLDTNYLVLRRVRRQGDWVWQAGMISTMDTNLRWLNVEQETHQPVPPGVVRWIADPRDDMIWTRCGGGCCVVDRPRQAF